MGVNWPEVTAVADCGSPNSKPSFPVPDEGGLAVSVPARNVEACS